MEKKLDYKDLIRDNFYDNLYDSIGAKVVGFEVSYQYHKRDPKLMDMTRSKIRHIRREDRLGKLLDENDI